MNKEIVWCFCGRKSLVVNGVRICPLRKHPFATWDNRPKPKTRQPKRSGRSKSPYAYNEY